MCKMKMQRTIREFAGERRIELHGGWSIYCDTSYGTVNDQIILNDWIAPLISEAFAFAFLIVMISRVGQG